MELRSYRIGGSCQAVPNFAKRSLSVSANAAAQRLFASRKGAIGLSEIVFLRLGSAFRVNGDLSIGVAFAIDRFPQPYLGQP